MKTTHSGDEIRQFILNNVGQHPSAITGLVSRQFGIARQSVNRHMNGLIKEGALESKGRTRNKTYMLRPMVDKSFRIPLTADLEEDAVWRHELLPLLEGVRGNVSAICEYGFTEMLNNAIAHSEGTSVQVALTLFANEVRLIVSDNGVGIFDKITRALELENTRHAVLELSKGKLTTDEEHHTGEGIFFATRMLDVFSIHSGGLAFLHSQDPADSWLLERSKDHDPGTAVFMNIRTDSSRAVTDVFETYASVDGDYSFTKTHFPVMLVRYGEENLVSRSQAKRLLARLESFREVFLDFEGVDFIGRAFADEIFRVFRRNHPDIDLVWVSTNEAVRRMIWRALLSG